MEKEHESIEKAFAEIASTLGRKANEVRSAIGRYFASVRKPMPDNPNPSRRITTEDIQAPAKSFPAFIGPSIALRVDGWKPIELGLAVERRMNFDWDLEDRTILAARRMEENGSRRCCLRPRKPLKIR